MMSFVYPFCTMMHFVCSFVYSFYPFCTMMHFVCPFYIFILSILCNNAFCMPILCNDAFCMSISN
ncbi:hypothetical protein GIB67_027184 [Kingdonia uniflora]|uniref:Uncharacterized protein n=1 Tax=Kingdonia uniflora TaxID=39325 RepID=A0A7J7P213_9MAGN|nr:hypothetical protein GIB67_027184 [Kingdonia uniflora]